MPSIRSARLALLAALLSLTAIGRASARGHRSEGLTEVPRSLVGRDFAIAAQVEDTSHPWRQGRMVVCRGLRVYDPQLIRFRLRGDSLAIEADDTRRGPATTSLAIVRADRRSVWVDLTPYLTAIQRGVDVISGRMQPGRLAGASLRMIANDIRHLEARVDYVYETDSVPYRIAERKAIVLLPDPPMTPRPADSRLGMRNDGRPFINRFDIDAEPVITFHIDDAFPPLWREAIRQGVDDWNRAFATIGRPATLRAVTFAESGPAFDAYAFGTHCFYSVGSDVANAEGRHWCDPRTGQILQASVLFHSGVLAKLHAWLFMQTAAYLPAARSRTLSDSIAQRLLRYAAAHEVGHCLGLEHNFRASYAYPTDSLRSPAFCRAYGTTASIMDYARFNYVAQPGDGVTDVCPPLLGPYDIYAIQAAYGSFADEAGRQAFIDRHQADERCRYKRERKGAEGLDPEVQHSDLGNDALASTRLGVANLRHIASHIAEWNPEGADPFDGMPASRCDLARYYFELLSHVLPSAADSTARNYLAGELADGYRFLLSGGATEADSLCADEQRRLLLDHLQPHPHHLAPHDPHPHDPLCAPLP